MSLVLLSSASLSFATNASAAKKEVDLNGTYHASLGIQTATQHWLQRPAYYDKSQNADLGTDAGMKLEI